MEKCDYCLYRDDCIGEVPGPDGKCLGFAVPRELQKAYQAFSEKEAVMAKLNPCLCGCVPELVLRRENYGYGDYPLVAKLRCSCGLTSKEFIVDGFYGTTTTVDDLIAWWNERFSFEEVPGDE